MAGTAACGNMATTTGRLASGSEKVAIGATTTELGNVDRLAREGGLLRIDCTMLIKGCCPGATNEQKIGVGSRTWACSSVP